MMTKAFPLSRRKIVLKTGTTWRRWVTQICRKNTILIRRCPSKCCLAWREDSSKASCSWVCRSIWVPTNRPPTSPCLRNSDQIYLPNNRKLLTTHNNRRKLNSLHRLGQWRKPLTSTTPLKTRAFLLSPTSKTQPWLNPLPLTITPTQARNSSPPPKLSRESLPPHKLSLFSLPQIIRANCTPETPSRSSPCTRTSTAMRSPKTTARTPRSKWPRKRELSSNSCSKSKANRINWI